MNRKIIALLLASSLSGLALAGNALGEPPKHPPPAPVAGKATLGVAVIDAELVATGWRVSKLIGSEVRNDADEKIGKIDDMVVATNGSLSVAIIQVGGFLGMGGHLVAIPVEQLSVAPNMSKIVLPKATKAALKSLPEFKYTS